MSLLPCKDHTLIIQTAGKKEPEPCEIKMNVTRKKKNRAHTELRVQKI